MSRFFTRTSIAAAVLLGSIASVASAQSGPDGAGAGPAPAATTAQAAKLGQANVNAFLKDLGYQVGETKDAGNGFYSTQTTIKKDGWTFHVEVLLDTKAGSTWLISPLGNPLGTGDQTAGLLKLLEANHTMAPFFFSIRAADRRICMNYEIPNLALAPQVFQSSMNGFLGKVRATHGVWNTANWQQPAGGNTVQPADGGQPTNTVRPQNKSQGAPSFQPVQD